MQTACSHHNFFLAPLCQVASELFYCRVVRRLSVCPSRLRGGGVYLRNASVTVLSLILGMQFLWDDINHISKYKIVKLFGIWGKY